MRAALRTHGWLLAWLALLVTTFLFRSLTPIDETRYVSVAWEMWLRGDFLVPYINGAPYSHKPPMLFWLFNAGWSVFGVNEWWPRLVPPLFALAALYLSQVMARRLWPDRPQVAVLAPWVLGSCLFWALFSTAILFDMLLAFMVIVALLGLLCASKGRRLSGWLLVGFACGLGILVKGPVMLLHIAFPALLAPWWSKIARQHPWQWYASLFGAVALAAGIALAWALPAASAGGPAYEQAILWHQTADRMVSSFAHSRPVWWFLPLLPVMLFPWFIWPPLWRSLRALRHTSDHNIRFLLSWLIPTFIAFSLVSGKQLHYLFPLFPAFALLTARTLDGYTQKAGRFDTLLPALLMAATGVILLFLPGVPGINLPKGIQTISPFWGIAMLIVASVFSFLRRGQPIHQAGITLAIAGSAVAVLLLGGISQLIRPIYDVSAAARVLSQLQQQGAPIANVDTYHGQFQFLGRLKKPLIAIHDAQVTSWAQTHPDGYLVMYPAQALAKNGPQPIYTQAYRGRYLMIWSARQIADPQ